jgi:hypothetical protein
MAVTGDVSKINVAAHTVNFGGNNLGFTQDGSEITYTPEYVDIMADQLGKTVLDKRLVGEDVKVKLVLKEVDRDALLIAIPGASAASGAASATGMDIGSVAGKSIVEASSGVLILHPVNLAAGSSGQDWTIPIAVVSSPVTIPAKVDAETVLEVEFQAIADPTQADYHHLLRYGY